LVDDAAPPRPDAFGPAGSAGADIEAVSAPDSGGVPSGTALAHAAVFGMTEVVDVLVAAGAKIHSLEQAAAAGEVTGWPLHRFIPESRIRALVFAADHQRLEVIDQLIAAPHPAAGRQRAATRFLNPHLTWLPGPVYGSRAGRVRLRMRRHAHRHAERSAPLVQRVLIRCPAAARA
jgi:hypothetical protein